MSRHKTPNIQKPLEQYLINNNNYAKTPNPNNFIINKKIEMILLNWIKKFVHFKLNILLILSEII